MAPPTICILALLLFQAVVALLLRPWVLVRLQTSERWARVSDVILEAFRPGTARGLRGERLRSR